MATRLPSASQWQAVMDKFQVKDNGLLKALATFAKVGDDDPKAMLAALELVMKCLSGLFKDKEAATKKDVVRFLNEVQSAGEKAKKELAATVKKAA